MFISPESRPSLDKMSKEELDSVSHTPGMPNMHVNVMDWALCGCIRYGANHVIYVCMCVCACACVCACVCMCVCAYVCACVCA